MTEIRTPEIVLVPKGYTVEQATVALTLCRRMGLLKENGSGAGWLLIPAEAGKYFASQGDPESELDRLGREALRGDPR